MKHAVHGVTQVSSQERSPSPTQLAYARHSICPYLKLHTIFSIAPFGSVAMRVYDSVFPDYGQLTPGNKFLTCFHAAHPLPKAIWMSGN